MAMDRSTGKVLWKKDLDLPVSGGVGVGYGLVLVGTLKGEVIALDSGSGERKWRAKVTSEVLSAPATNGDVVIVQTQDDRLIGLDASDGRAALDLRKHAGGAHPARHRRAAGDQPLAFAGLSSGKVIALDTRRGLPVWEQRVAMPQGRSELERVVDIDGGLLLSGGNLYVATYQGRVAALEQKAGASSGSAMRPATSVSPRASAASTSARPTAPSKASTSVRPRRCGATTRLARRQLSAPEVFSSYVAVGDLEGYLHLLSQVDGRFVGRERIDSDGLRARPLVVRRLALRLWQQRQAGGLHPALIARHAPRGVVHAHIAADCTYLQRPLCFPNYRWRAAWFP